ncbi:MAG: DUF4127 family protein [Negativicutes bacterium]|nr:DUF4127 family protein [Negativicutes bacterium]
MRKRFALYLLLIAGMAAALFAVRIHQGQLLVVDAPPLAITHSYQTEILLVPLDSRPPCTQYLEQVGAIAHVAVKMPPASLLDNYRKPADKAAIREWLLDNSKHAETAIISMDMLVHGGLVTSRLNAGSDEDIQKSLELLQEIRRRNPRLKLYAFSIIPRLLIADTQDNARYQKDMAKYSVQKDLLLTFENPLALKKLQKLEAKLPADLIRRYTALYARNYEVNLALVDMVKNNIIDGLIIGQDDGQPFGLPNIAKSRIEHYIRQSGLEQKVIVTRGTDEVALTLLGRIIAQNAAYSPKIHVRYSHPDAASVIMPFMPHSVETTVNEKIRIINGVKTALEHADYVLYVHIGTGGLGNSSYRQAVREVKALMGSGRPVALVDLTENYYATETLLPWLIDQDINPMSLAAYCGWNTTSNSIGTALAQIAVFGAHPPSLQAAGPAIATQHANWEFLISRLLDDWHYQKEIQPVINKQLMVLGINPYQLDKHYAAINDAIQRQIRERANTLYSRHLRSQSATIDTADGPLKVTFANLEVTARLPWDRTFEVRVTPSLKLIKLNE